MALNLLFALMIAPGAPAAAEQLSAEVAPVVANAEPSCVSGPPRVRTRKSTDATKGDTPAMSLKAALELADASAKAQ